MMEGREVPVLTNYPQRVDEAEVCRDFLRTGRCKYGESCKYHHPLEGPKTNDPNEPPFPVRPNEPTCQYYLKNASCKFGQSCKFHHPPHIMLTKGINNMLDPSATSGLLSNATDSLAHTMKCQIILDPIEDNHTSSGSTERHLHKDPLPQRPGEPDCIYYLRNGKCKYGFSCKYNHPPAQFITNNTSEGNHITGQKSNAHPTLITRPRSSSAEDAGIPQEAHVLSSMRRNSTNPVGVSSPLQYHRQLQGQNVLGTIENSFHQYPNVSLDMKNVTILGNFQNGTNALISSPKMGSPSISSTTAASSYDNLSLETLPPSRGRSQSLSAYTDPPKFSSPQVNFVGQQSTMYNMNNNHNNNAPAMQFSVATYHQANFNDNPISRNAPHPSSRPLPNNTDYVQTHHHQGIQSGRQVQSRMQHSSMSSNTSLASLSASSEPNEFIMPQQQQPPPPDQNQQRTDMTMTMAKRTRTDPRNIQSRNNVVDDGLSMMTDALLTMLDTPDDGSYASTKSQYEMRSTNNNMMMNNNINQHRQPYYPHQGYRLNNNMNNSPNFVSRLPNSLPDFLLADNSARTLSMNNTSNSDGNSSHQFDFLGLSQSSHHPMNMNVMFDHQNNNDSDDINHHGR